MRVALESEGYDVLQAPDGKTAMRRSETKVPDRAGFAFTGHRRPPVGQTATRCFGRPFELGTVMVAEWVIL
jgi:hypothetical protein